MKITTSQLRQIIKEEAQKAFGEEDLEDKSFCVFCDQEVDGRVCPYCKEYKGVERFGDLPLADQERIRSAL